MFPEILLIVAAVVLWWAFVLNVIGLLSGWSSLAHHYRARAPFDLTQTFLGSGRLGLSNYGGCLVFGVNADGLSLKVFFPFRPGHPPLFIPWSDIDASAVEGWIFGYLDLRFRQAPGVRLRVAASLGAKIITAANRSWSDGAPPIE